MIKKAYQITAEGKNDLEKELEELKGRRGEIAEKIAAARDFGDLSENAEYDAAREEQGLVETRIAEIEDILLQAEIITSKKSSKVGLGSVVTLKSDEKEVVYQLVGPVEANPLEGKISNESPIGTSLVGKKVGEEVLITTPKGETRYQVIEVI